MRGRTWYRTSPEQLPPGTNLQPAKYGEQPAYLVVRNAYQSGEEYLASLLYADWLTNAKVNAGWLLPCWIVEAIFESIREQELPHLISRLRSTYLFEDLASSQRFLELHKGGTGHIYECSAVLEQTAHPFDLQHWNNSFDVALPLKPRFAALREAARRYFSGAGTADPLWEILTDQPVQIVRLVSILRGGAVIF